MANSHWGGAVREGQRRPRVRWAEPLAVEPVKTVAGPLTHADLMFFEELTPIPPPPAPPPMAPTPPTTSPSLMAAAPFPWAFAVPSPLVTQPPRLCSLHGGAHLAPTSSPPLPPMVPRRSVLA